MYVFVCVGCGATLTAPLSQVALPVHARQKYGNGVQLPVLMEPGTFAVDPEPSGPPYRKWEEIDPEEAAARGIYAPVSSVSYGASGAIVIAPGDARGTVLILEKASGYCCGFDGGEGPNMACEACGLPVASRIDDCSLWQAVWLAPDAVLRVAVDGAGTAPPSWEELTAQGMSTPLFEPIAGWGVRWWSWSPRWEAAAGRALAYLLAASQGAPVVVPDGLPKDMFQRALDTLLPQGPPARRAVLAGPGLPAPGAEADILLVPTHPHTGQDWTPAGAAHLAPLPWGVWLWLAFPPAEPARHRVGRQTRQLLALDEPHPSHLPFRADWEVFHHTLVRLPEARSPWMRDILTHLTHPIRARLF